MAPKNQKVPGPLTGNETPAQIEAREKAEAEQRAKDEAAAKAAQEKAEAEAKAKAAAGAGQEGQKAAKGGIARRRENLKKILMDRFKLSVAFCLKNRSIKDNGVELVKLEHRHFFDSHNRQGRPNTHTEFNCGHKHAVSYEVTPSGEIIAESMKCGPALMEKVTMTPSGKRRSSLIEIDFGFDPDKDDGSRAKDAHVHALEYMKTEDLTVKL